MSTSYTPKNRLLILRGLPGSGKSTAAKGYVGDLGVDDVVHCESDHFFYDANGVYCFSVEGLAEAHASCQRLASASMVRGVPLVIVSNTSTEGWEIVPYVACAEKLGYQIEVIDMYDGGVSVEVLASRNIHSVPLEAYWRMIGRYQRYPEHPIKNGVWAPEDTTAFLSTFQPVYNARVQCA